jgi:hypothetical protein
MKEEDWIEKSHKHKLLFIADILHSIDEEEKKVVPCDLQAYRSMLKTLGMDYYQNPDVPDILEEEIKWKE